MFAALPGVERQPIAGRGPQMIRNDGRAFGKPGLLEVVLRHGPAQRGEQLADIVGDFLREGQPDAGDLRHEFRRQVVRGGADAAGGDHDVGLRHGLPPRPHDAFGHVPDGDDRGHVQTGLDQLVGDMVGVGIDHLPGCDLVPGTQNGGPFDHTHSHSHAGRRNGRAGVERRRTVSNRGRRKKARLRLSCLTFKIPNPAPRSESNPSPVPESALPRTRLVSLRSLSLRCLEPVERSKGRKAGRGLEPAPDVIRGERAFLQLVRCINLVVPKFEISSVRMPFLRRSCGSRNPDEDIPLFRLTQPMAGHLPSPSP